MRTARPSAPFRFRFPLAATALVALSALTPACVAGAAPDSEAAETGDSDLGTKCSGILWWRACRLQSDWERVYAAQGGSRPYALRAAADGGVYVAGSGVQLRYDGAGRLVYATPLTFGESASIPFEMAVDGDGSVYVAAVWGLAKLTPEGTVSWKVAAPLGPEGFPRRVLAVTVVGDLVLATGEVTEAYRRDGTLVWSVALTGSDGQPRVGSRIVSDGGDGAIVLVGDGLAHVRATDGQVTWKVDRPGFGASDLAVAANGDTFVVGNGGYEKHITARVSAAGEIRWIQELHEADTMMEEQQKVALDSAGNVLLTAFATTGSARGDRLVTAKYTPDGALQWKQSVKGFASLSTDIVNGPALVVVGDRTYATANQTTYVYDASGARIATFDDGSAAVNQLARNTAGEVFLSTIRPDGIHVWKLGRF